MFHFRDEEARIGEVSAWAGWEAVLGLTSGFFSHSPMLPLFIVDPPGSPTLPDVSEQSEQLPEDSQLKDIRDALYSLWGCQPGCYFLLLALASASCSW